MILSLFLGIHSVRAQGITTDFTHDAVPCGSAVVNFAATVAGPVTLSDCLFTWDFGDGKSPVTGQNVSNGFPVTPGALHTIFPSPAEVPFQVTLVVTSRTTGLELARVSKPVVVRPAPIPEATDMTNLLRPFDNCANTPTPQNPNFAVSVGNASQDVNTITAYKLDWGDGSPVETPAKTDFPVKHTYTKLGLFRMKFSATGVNGCEATKEYMVKNQGNPAIGISSGGNTSGCAPITFAFRINRVYNNDPQTTYTWDFGDGTTLNWTIDSIKANDSTVFHTFTRSSCDQPTHQYTVKVTASNACKSTEASVSGVVVGIRPIPSFNVTNLCEGQPVQFHNTTIAGTNFDCTTNVIYKWDFGDGSPILTTTSASTIGHTFPTNNNEFLVKLTAINDCKDSTTFPLKVVITRKPVAIATLSAASGCKPLAVNVTNNSTGDITSTTWTVTPAAGWSFAGGTNANSTNPQFIFNTKGNYVITLQVRNNCTFDQKSFNVFVDGAIDATLPAIGNQCDTYTFDASQSSVFRLNLIPNEVVRANWVVTPASGYTFINGTNAQSVYPQIRFDTQGDYTVQVGLNNGCDSLVLSRSFKFAASPKAVATPTTTEGCVPFHVNFDNQSTGYQLTYNWSVNPAAGVSFSGGTTSASQNPDILFTKEGNYNVKLTVTNGCNTDTKTFAIRAKDKPAITLQPFPDQCETGTFTIAPAFINVATNNGGAITYNWVVTPSAGVTFESGTTATSANPAIRFAAPGSYQISVTATNECGSDQKSATVNVVQQAHLVTTVSDTSGCAPKIFTFTDNSTGTGLSHLWTVSPAAGFSWATGNTTSASPAITFTTPGVYTVTHSLTSLCGTISKTFTLTVFSVPSLNLSPIPDQCSAPYTLIIDSTNFKINQNGKSITGLQWSVTPAANVTYLDGTTVNSTYPHIQFNQNGQYTVMAQVQNDCGLSTASRLFNVLAHATEQSTASATTGCAPLKVHFTDQSLGDQLVHKWSVLPAAGWVITPSASAASPDITFSKAGIYSVTHKISNLCGFDTHTYTVKVKEIPDVTLSPMPNSCNSFTYIADLQNLNVTPNQNDSIAYQWTVTPNRAVTFLNNTSDTSHFPVIQIADTGVFKITVRVTGECGFKEASQTVGITVGPQISLTPTLSTKCLPSDLTFSGVVFGQNLVYNWSVLPAVGANFIGGTTSKSPLPQIRFSRPGNYTVSLNTTNNCSNDIKSWNFQIISQPTIAFNTVNDTCDQFTFKAERYVKVQDNGNAIIKYNWTITPSTGFTFVDSTSTASAFPHILFTGANTYKLTMDVTNDCGTTTNSQSFTIDQFVQVEAGADTTVCTNNNLFQLTGSPAGGIWSIMPATASNVLKVIGKTYYLDLNVPGNYTLTYHRGNNYCFSEDIRHFNILPLPTVDAGRDFTLCANDRSAHPLTGTPAGGIWSGSGVNGSSFSAVGLAPGSYILKYTWTDPTTQCANTDQLVARLLDVPGTSFTAPSTGCRDVAIKFSPSGAPNTIYNWDFGDGQTATSSGTINHTYRKGGIYNVKLVSSDPNNCSVSSSAPITIYDDIVMPKVSIDPPAGCGPLTVTFTVDTTGTTANGQSYSWNFGNGQTSNQPQLGYTATYNSAIGDTVYQATLTISNSCFSRTVNYPVTVHSRPYANFVMPHDWECSPATVQFKNLTVDRTATFLWSFGDGTTSTAFQPSHLFTTGKSATEYIVKLVAQNQCGKDSVSKPILIKPNSIEAFMQMSARIACTGDPVTFTNFSTDTVTKITNYYWDFGDGNVATTWNSTHTYTAPGKYTVKLFVDNGCSSGSAQDQIEVLPPLQLKIMSRDSACIGDTISFKAVSDSGPFNNTVWNFEDNGTATGVTVTYRFTTGGWQTVKVAANSVTSFLHCPGWGQKRVFVKDKPVIPVLQDLQGCSPLTVNLSGPNQNPVLWNFGEDSTWTASGQHVFYNRNTDNNVVRRKVTMISENILGCRTVSTFWATVYPTPTARIGLSSLGGSPEKVFLNSLSTNTTACEWLLPDGTTSQGCDSVLLKLYSNGFYKIALRSSNQYGCSDTTSIIHQTIIKGLFVPNGFQPSNNNNQVNVFKPVGIGLQSYWVGVYDTWGNPIWQSDKLFETQPAEGWDGKDNKGKPLPMDVYVWRIRAVFIDGTVWRGMKGKDGILRTEGTITLIK